MRFCFKVSSFFIFVNSIPSVAIVTTTAESLALPLGVVAQTADPEFVPLEVIFGTVYFSSSLSFPIAIRAADVIC